MDYSHAHLAFNARTSHLPTLLAEHVTVFLLTLTLLVLIGVLIYMTQARIPDDIEFRPVYFTDPLVVR